MEYHLLLPAEAATLLGTSQETIKELITQGKLGAFRDDGEWWIPLQCLSGYGGEELQVDPACALAKLVQKDGAFFHTFADHPEAAERIEKADFAPGSVGVCLQQALRMYRRAEAAQVSPAPRQRRRG